MADFILRPAEKNDAEQIIKIWHSSFGDSEAYIHDTLACGLLGSAVVAEMGGLVRSCMFAFDGLAAGSIPAAYLFALCTDMSCRGLGLGRAVCAYAAEKAQERGAGAVFLRPADVGLEKWYADTFGAVAVSRSHVENFRPDLSLGEMAREIDAGEYFRLRNAAAWIIPETMLRAQNCIHRHWGGAFLACESGVVCAEKNACGLLVRELTAAKPEKALASAAAYFGVEELGILRTGGDGPPLMALPLAGGSPTLPEIPPLPFTLD